MTGSVAELETFPVDGIDELDPRWGVWRAAFKQVLEKVNGGSRDSGPSQVLGVVQGLRILAAAD